MQQRVVGNSIPTFHKPPSKAGTLIKSTGYNFKKSKNQKNQNIQKQGGVGLRITHYALRIYALRITHHYALRITHYALRITHYTLRYALPIAHCALCITSIKQQARSAKREARTTATTATTDCN